MAHLKMHSGRIDRNEIVVSMLQGLVLLLFNETASMTYGEICKRISSPGHGTQVDPKSAEMVNTIRGISGAPVCLLLCSGKAGRRNALDIEEAFSVNNEFDPSHTHTSIGELTSFSSGSQGTVAIAALAAFAERAFVVDGIVVAYMRARRRAAVADVTKDVVALLKYPASATEVRRRIDTLVARDVLRLDDTASDGVSSVA